MDNQLYRKKSMERISSPEKLNDYIKVANPGIWMILGAIILFLFGVCFWSIFGRLDTVIKTAVVSDGSKTVCYINEGDISSVANGMTVNINGAAYAVIGISDSHPQRVSDGYLLHILDIEDTAWVYEAYITEKLPEGIYKGTITVDSVSPISFITN